MLVSMLAGHGTRVHEPEHGREHGAAEVTGGAMEWAHDIVSRTKCGQTVSGPLTWLSFREEMVEVLATWCGVVESRMVRLVVWSSRE